MIDPKSRVTVSSSVYLREFGEELVLLDFGKGEYYALDAIGAAILRKLEAGADVADVAAYLVREYDVASDVALADVAALVDEMKGQGLIEVFSP